MFPSPLHRPVDPEVAETAAMLAEDIIALRRVFARGRKWTPTTIEYAYHHVYATAGPWLKLARSRRDSTDSPADRTRWSAWISALTPPEHLVARGSHADVCDLAGKARNMLRTLRQTLTPCPSVGSVAAGIEQLIRAGDLAPAARIFPDALAKKVGVPVEHVDLVLADLAARGLVEIRASGRAIVTSTAPDAGSPEGGIRSAAGRRRDQGRGERGERGMTTLRSVSSKPLLPNLERDVLALLAEGHRGPEVAARLGLANVQRVRYRIRRISMYFGLKEATQPQLVDLAYALGALPAPGPAQPLVLRAAEYHLVRMVAAGGTLTEHARKQGVSVSQANYIARKAQSALDAATLPALIRRAWQRQILGPTAFAADLARMHAQQPAEPDLGCHVIVPLASGHRLALPAWGPHPTRYLDLPDEIEAQTAARFLSARDGYAHLRITPPEHPGGPFRVSWRRQEATPSSGHGLALDRPRKPPLYQDRSA